MSYGISSSFVKLLKNMNSKMKISMQIPKGTVSFSSSNLSLKQGFNVISILFNLFINDIHRIFDQTLCQAPNLLNVQLNDLMYCLWLDFNIRN